MLKEVFKITYFKLSTNPPHPPPIPLFHHCCIQVTWILLHTPELPMLFWEDDAYFLNIATVTPLSKMFDSVNGSMIVSCTSKSVLLMSTVNRNSGTHRPYTDKIKRRNKKSHAEITIHMLKHSDFEKIPGEKGDIERGRWGGGGEEIVKRQSIK